MPEIEYFYAAHSAFAYLGSARLMVIAAAANRRINHKPMDLRQVLAANAIASAGPRPINYVEYFLAARSTVGPRRAKPRCWGGDQPITTTT